MLNNFKPKELPELFVRIYCTDGNIVTKTGITRNDFEVKIMNEEMVGYKYCVLVYPNGDGTFKERYEASMYEAIKIKDMTDINDGMALVGADAMANAIPEIRPNLNIGVISNCVSKYLLLCPDMKADLVEQYAKFAANSKDATELNMYINKINSLGATAFYDDTNEPRIVTCKCTNCTTPKELWNCIHCEYERTINLYDCKIELH
jgi:hypothetical protein